MGVHPQQGNIGIKTTSNLDLIQEGDVFINHAMEFYRIVGKQLRKENFCKFYLQVLLIPDVTYGGRKEITYLD